MNEFIPYSCQLIEEDDIVGVVEVLRSSHLTQGPKIREFETALEEYCQVPHAIAVSSATAGLHLAMLSLGIKSGSLVWTTPITFVASANAGLYVGANVDFVDVDPLTANMSIPVLKEKLFQAKKDNRLPDVLVPVHFSGRSAGMSELKALSREYGFFIIEDAAHSLGGIYQSQMPVGCCHYSDITVLSFHAVKSVTTAEGGACLTTNPEIAKKLLKLRTHGITREPAELINKNLPAWHYEQQELGYHYRLTDIQASLGITQLKKLDSFINRRREIAIYYNQHLSQALISKPPLDLLSAWHLYSIRVPEKIRDPLYKYCIEQGIGVNTHYQTVHLQPYYQSLGQVYSDLAVAENYSKQTLAIPIHPKLTEAQQQRVIKVLTDGINSL